MSTPEHEIKNCKIVNCYNCFKEQNKQNFKHIFVDNDQLFNVFRKDENETKDEFVDRIFGND